MRAKAFESLLRDYGLDREAAFLILQGLTEPSAPLSAGLRNKFLLLSATKMDEAQAALFLRQHGYGAPS